MLNFRNFRDPYLRVRVLTRRLLVRPRRRRILLRFLVLLKLLKCLPQVVVDVHVLRRHPNIILRRHLLLVPRLLNGLDPIDFLQDVARIRSIGPRRLI